MRLKATFLSIAIALFLFETVSSQNLFTRVYGGNSYDFGAEVMPTPDGGYLVAGTTGSYGLESGQIMLIKTDSNGYEEWRKYYGDQYADQAESTQLGIDNNLIIVGNTESPNNSYQFYAIKTTLNGDTIWTNSYGTAEWDFCRQVAALPDGGYALFGNTYSTGEGDYYLIRINNDGDTLWTKTYGGNAEESGESIALAADGGFYLAGHTESFGAGKKDMYVVRTDEFGDTLWTKTFGGPEDDFCYAVAVTPDAGYVLAGGTFNNTLGKSDFIVIKEDGTQQWTRHDPHTGDNYWLDVMIEPITANITAVGYFTEGGAGLEDGRIIRIGADGIWNGVARGHGSEENDRFYDVKRCSDGGYVMVGNTQGYLNRFDDVYLVRADNLGISVGPELGVNEIELDGSVYDVRIGPNPFGDDFPTLFVQNFDGLMKDLSSNPEVNIYNSVGQLVVTQSVSSAATQLNFQSLDNGIYYYQIISGRLILATGKAVKLN